MAKEGIVGRQLHGNMIIADFSQLSGRLAVFAVNFDL